MRRIAVSLSKRVLLIDTDTQGQCSRILGVSAEKGLSELLLDDAKPTDVLTEARGNLWLLAGSRALAQAKRAIAQREFKSEAVLTEALEVYVEYFDYVILDQLREHFRDRLCNPIHYSVKLSEASGLGKTIFEYSAKDRGAIDYAKLVERVNLA